MLLENLKRVFKKPDKEREEEKIREINESPLEKKDVPAMIISAYLVFIPIVLLMLGIIALVAFLYVS